jgi:hypothetical protein
MPIDSNQSTGGGVMKYPILLAIVILVGLAQSAFAADPAFVILEYKTMNFEDCISTADKMIVRAGGHERRVFRSKFMMVTKFIVDNDNFIITCSKPDQKFLVQMPTPTG